MVNALRKQSACLVAAAATIWCGACTVHDQTAPPLSGPSTSALSLTVTATPDSITQDGASQSSIQVVARDANARPISGLPIRIDVNFGGVVQDYGTLSAKSIVTGTDGKATTVYTAPPPLPAGSTTPSCHGASGQCVDIVATPTSTNFQTVTPTSATLRLVPPGVIPPPAITPYATFSYSPTSVNMGVPVRFDASNSCGTQPNSGVCPPPIPGTNIISYDWLFGDGVVAVGQAVTHTYAVSGGYTVTLKVTNDSGGYQVSTQTVQVGTVTAPQANFVFSPTNPVINQTVVFNGDTSTAATGHTLTAYNWNFGDGTTGSGYTASHAYAIAGSYNVVLSVLDDTGQKATTSKTVTVGTGLPTATIVFSPSQPAVGQQVLFDGTGSTAYGGASIVSYQWSFGDGSPSLSGATTNHVYSSAGTYTVVLTLQDSQGRTGQGSVTVTVK